MWVNHLCRRVSIPRVLRVALWIPEPDVPPLAVDEDVVGLILAGVPVVHHESVAGGLKYESKVQCVP